MYVCNTHFSSPVDVRIASQNASFHCKKEKREIFKSIHDTISQTNKNFLVVTIDS